MLLGEASRVIFSHFLLQLAGRVGLDLSVDVYEPRDFTVSGADSCSMCGGIVSGSLPHSLVTEGIRIPLRVIQRRLDSYCLHMDVGSVRIETPLKEKRIVAVYRGVGRRGSAEKESENSDGFLLALAVSRRTNPVRERVALLGWNDGRPMLKTLGG